MALVWEIRKVRTATQFHPRLLDFETTPGASTQRVSFDSALFIGGWLVPLRVLSMRLLRGPSRHEDLQVLLLRRSRPHGAQC